MTRPETAAREASALPRSRPLGGLVSRLDADGLLADVSTAALGPQPAGASSMGPLVRGLTYDSRHVEPGWLFVAVAGAHADGHTFVPGAVERGAAAVIVERPLAGVAVPQIVVADSRRALAAAAAWWFDDPSRQLGIVGITGTDGKTTTTFLAAAVLEAAGISTGLITTAAAKIGRDLVPNAEHVTTPEAPELQATLRAMVEAGNEAAVIETTSHGLTLHRVDEIAYDIGVFTNLSHEHLELHGTFEAYREAKLSLFRRLGRGSGAPATGRGSIGWPATAVVNCDDPAAEAFIGAARGAGAAVITFGESPAALVRAIDVSEGQDGLTLEVVTPRWRGTLSVRLRGRFNCLNALAAVSLGEAIGLDPEVVRAGIASLVGVPGRMEPVNRGQPFEVIVDYAHSPAALQTVLDSLAPGVVARGGGLIAVFGSAGERDVAKRELMGRIAGQRCRAVFVTDEDPRGEDRVAIIDQIATGAEAAGLRRGKGLHCIPDRRQAILAALRLARPGDVVLLAGKGHEQTIIMSDGPMAWDEKAEAIAALALLGFGDRPAGGGSLRTVEEGKA